MLDWLSVRPVTSHQHTYSIPVRPQPPDCALSEAFTEGPPWPTEAVSPSMKTKAATLIFRVWFFWGGVGGGSFL